MDLDFKDRPLVCADCNEQFTFTAAEQEFFYEKGFAEPKRCKVCRDARKQRSRTGGGSMGGNGGGMGSDRPRRSPSSSGPMQQNRPQYEAVCAQCGAKTTVPFQPSGKRPVYCQGCFKDRRAPSMRD